MNEYLEKRKILFEHQSGFRGRYSTDTCLADLSDYVKGVMSAGRLVGMVCIDLRKAFDTVDHLVLLDKLRFIGAADSAVNWFCSYLSDRQQCVEVSGSRSSFMNISCGVPQGSILGPLLYLVYTNDLPEAIHEQHLIEEPAQDIIDQHIIILNVSCVGLYVYMRMIQHLQ